jgi:hypothetical protein
MDKGKEGRKGKLKKNINRGSHGSDCAECYILGRDAMQSGTFTDVS